MSQEYWTGAWGKFYIFDVFCTISNKFLPYPIYSYSIFNFGLDFIKPLKDFPQDGKIISGDDTLLSLINSANFLLKEGAHAEGIVIKNYNFTNRRGNAIWAKVINPEFENSVRKRRLPGIELAETEPLIILEYLDEHFIKKEVCKLLCRKADPDRSTELEWDRKYIPEILGITWHEFIIENIWDILKKKNNPKIDFKILKKLFNEEIIKFLMLL